MKLLLALFAVIAAASAVPVDPWAGGWQDPWQQNPWQNPWQDPWQAQHHKVHHVQAHHVQQQPPIPPLHPQPLKLDVHAHVQKIPYHQPKIHHPHLIGYEVAVHEPEVKHVVKPVHHHHSW